MMPEKRDAKLFKYSEPSDLRYAISDDEFSQSRIHTLLQLTDSLKTDVPVFAGLVLYGSLTKGKALTQDALPHTDMDTILYLDRSRLMNDLPRLAADPTFQKLLDSVKNDPAFNIEGLNPEEIDGVFTDVAVVKYYEDRVKFRFDELTTETTKPHISVNASIIGQENGTSLYGMVTDLADDKKLPKRRSDKQWSPDIAGLFMLDIGGNLKEYRKSFFIRLGQEKPDRADAIWKITYREIKGWERIGPLDQKLKSQFPETSVQAQKYYAEGGPHISSTGTLTIPLSLN